MRYSFVPAITAVLLSVSVAADADRHATPDKPSFMVSQSMTVQARVEAIDHESREVTLKRADGEIIEIVASEEARNLGQVTVGDIVTAEYIKTMSVQVVADDGTEPGMAGVTQMARTEEGAMPGVAAVDTQVVTATVEEINIEANTFKLKGPDGAVNEYVARNPENLKKAEVGDIVIMTFREAVAISVAEGPAE